MSPRRAARRRIAVLAAVTFAVASAAAGCQTRSKLPPVIDRVEPELAMNHRDERLIIHGQGFAERLIANLDDPSQSRVDAQYRAWLVNDSGAEVELAEVTRVADDRLEATLRANAAAVGSYAVRVVDPWGNDVQAGSIEVGAPECASDADCDDGMSCTTDACADFRCTAKLATSACLIEGVCHEAGAAPHAACLVCDPERSTSAWMPAAASVGCDDGLLCTTLDRCDGAGACVGTAECSSPPPGDCHEPVGACTASGCEYAAKQVGTACDDGDACTAATTCDAAAQCSGGTPVCTGGVPPAACLDVVPVIAEPNTDVLLDARCTTDEDTPPAGLQASFDAEGDGTYEVPFASSLTLTRKFTAGVYQPHVLVRDSLSGVSWARRFLVVAPASSTLVVDTTAHEVGGTPQNKGGTGLSLYEAVAYANTLTQPSTITFAGPGTYLTTYLSVSRPGTAIVGGPGVTVDFQGGGSLGSCLDIGAAGVKVFALRFQNCNAQELGVKAPGAQIADCVFEALPGATGAAAKFETGGTFGPGNRVIGYPDHAIEVKSPDVVITGNHFRNNRGAIDIVSNHQNTVFEFNEVLGSTDTAVELGGSATNTRVRFNTFVGNKVAVATGNANGGEVFLSHNIFAQGSGCALAGSLSAYSTATPNLFFQNGGTGCAGAPSLPGNLTADPLFHDPSSLDLRLQPASPAVNVDPAVTLDVNGPLPNAFTGSGADLGAHESPY